MKNMKNEKSVEEKSKTQTRLETFPQFIKKRESLKVIYATRQRETNVSLTT